MSARDRAMLEAYIREMQNRSNNKK